MMPPSGKRVVVIGGGFGGMCCAIRLAHAGYEVVLLEQQEQVGGKLQRVWMQGYSFDQGPNLVYMPYAFQRVFESVGRRMEDYLTLYPITPVSRNRFADGTVVDVSSNRVLMQDQIASYSLRDALQYPAFLREASMLFEQAESHFMNHVMLQFQDKASLTVLRGLMHVHPLTSLHRLLQRYFHHPNTLAMFGRYATYVGSSPYQAPAIFAMLAHVETELGVFGVQGGTYRLAEALRVLACELGVHVQTSVKVKRLHELNGRIVGVEIDSGELAADFVVANGDLLSITSELKEQVDPATFSNAKMAGYEPSLSGFVTLVGLPRQYDKLLHHNVFFPERYKQEFNDIFKKRTAPADPALYVCWSGYSEVGLAPAGGSNLYILANSPYVTNGWNWEERGDGYRDFILRKLELYGLQWIRQDAEVLLSYTPQQLQRDSSVHRGSIPVISSKSDKQAFTQLSNQLKDIQGLWFVGGSTYPGGGASMAALSGQLVAERIVETYGGRSNAGMV